MGIEKEHTHVRRTRAFRTAEVRQRGSSSLDRSTIISANVEVDGDLWEQVLTEMERDLPDSIDEIEVEHWLDSSETGRIITIRGLR